MKPSQSKPQGLLEKDSSTTLFHSSRLHHFHFTALQLEIIKQNYKHNERKKKAKKKKKKKTLGESCILCAVKGLVTLFIGGSRYYLASLAERMQPRIFHMLLKITGCNKSLPRVARSLDHTCKRLAQWPEKFQPPRVQPSQASHSAGVKGCCW